MSKIAVLCSWWNDLTSWPNYLLFWILCPFFQTLLRLLFHVGLVFQTESLFLELKTAVEKNNLIKRSICLSCTHIYWDLSFTYLLRKMILSKAPEQLLNCGVIVLSALAGVLRSCMTCDAVRMIECSGVVRFSHNKHMWLPEALSYLSLWIFIHSASVTLI